LDTLGRLVDVTLFNPEEAVAYLDRRTGLDDPAWMTRPVRANWPSTSAGCPWR
jgi:hypothetical protein